MKRDFLESLGLEKEAIDKIMAENGKDIESHKSKASELETQIGSLTEKQKEYEKTVKELSKNNSNNEELNKTIEELKTNLETKDKEFTNYKQNNMLDSALNSYKPKNLKALKALLDNDLIKFDKDDVQGVKEQIEKLKESDSYLFESEEETETNTEPKGFKDIVSGGGSAANNDTTKSLKSMSYKDRVELKKTNPSLYDNLKGGN